MNRRVLAILLVAFVIAAACTYLVVRLVRNQTAASKPPAITEVVAAKSNIKLGTVLNADHLTTIKITGTPPKGSILAKDKNSLIGRGVLSDIYEGEPIIDNRLAASGSGGGLAATIPPGMRACAVKVDDVVNVSGFVTPGMRVDVLIAGNPPGQQNSMQGTQSRTLLQNIQVLSAGTDYQKDAEGKAKAVQVVNLLVTPEQAELLSLASSQVKIQLVLRNPLDTQDSKTSGATVAGIFGVPQSAPVQPVKFSAPVAAVKPLPPPPIPVLQIEVFNGATRSEAKFVQPGGDQPVGEKK